MTGVSSGFRGPDFYADMTEPERAAHAARDNGDLSPEMVAFDEQIDSIAAMSPADKAKVAQMKWEAIANG